MGSRPTFDIADIVRNHRPALEASHRLSTPQRRVLTAISRCRTAALGGHVEECDQCGHHRNAYNSCRNRHCPKCQSLARAQWLEADVFKALRSLREQKRQFDLIVLDPPKFAPTASFAEKASRGYKDINLNAMRLLRPGGLLATFSCSGGISADLFQKIVAGAAADAGMSANIIGRFHAAADHPVRIEFPEGEYLKGLLLRRA